MEFGSDCGGLPMHHMLWRAVLPSQIAREGCHGTPMARGGAGAYTCIGSTVEQEHPVRESINAITSPRSLAQARRRCFVAWIPSEHRSAVTSWPIVLTMLSSYV
jgi:hypothetical protein